MENVQNHRKQDQRSLVEVLSDSGDEDDEKVKDESCLIAHASSEIYLGVDLEPNEWIKDSGCSKHMTGNQKLFSTYKAYNGGNVVFGSNLRADRGKKIPREPNASSSSTTQNPSSSSLQIDVITDDNDVESPQSNSSSPSQTISSSSNVVSGVHQNPPHENHDLNNLLSQTISFQIQQRDEHHDGLRSIRQTLKNMMGGKRK
ncbi:hypothetical protein Tco_1485626 [Tanacetum coccineum]